MHRSLAALTSAALLLGGCRRVAPPVAPSAEVAAADPRGVEIYVIANHFHSDLAVPVAPVLARGGPTAIAIRRLPQAFPWVGLGYGDAKFYIGTGLGPARLLDFARTIVLPRNPAVMHLDGLASPLSDHSHPMVLRLTVSPARFADLMRRVDETFALKSGAPFVVNPGHGATDLFFGAAEPASAAHDCNHWIGDVLGRAGIPHNPVLDTASDGLAFDLKASGRARPILGALDAKP